MEPGYEGYADLGKVLATAGKPQTTAKDVIALEQALANAKIARDRAMHRDSINSAGTTGMAALPGMSGQSPDLLKFLQDAMMAGDNPASGLNSDVQAFGHAQENQSRGQAQALPLPSNPAYNDTTAADLNQILSTVAPGGHMLTPNTVNPTPLAKERVKTQQSRTRATDAQTEDRRAAADAHRASAERARRPPAEKGAHTKAAPAVGEVRKGYKFKGGDPADKNNWQKVY